MFILGIIIGILLSFVAMVWDASHDKPKLVWMDENYKLHLIKRRRNGKI